jgi:hypothetical protein
MTVMLIHTSLQAAGYTVVFDIDNLLEKQRFVDSQRLYLYSDSLTDRRVIHGGATEWLSAGVLITPVKCLIIVQHFTGAIGKVTACSSTFLQ